MLVCWFVSGECHYRCYWFVCVPFSELQSAACHLTLWWWAYHTTSSLYFIPLRNKCGDGKICWWKIKEQEKIHLCFGLCFLEDGNIFKIIEKQWKNNLPPTASVQFLYLHTSQWWQWAPASLPDNWYIVHSLGKFPRCGLIWLRIFLQNICFLSTLIRKEYF